MALAPSKPLSSKPVSPACGEGLDIIGSALKPKEERVEEAIDHAQGHERDADLEDLSQRVRKQREEDALEDLEIVPGSHGTAFFARNALDGKRALYRIPNSPAERQAFGEEQKRVKVARDSTPVLNKAVIRDGSFYSLHIRGKSLQDYFASKNYQALSPADKEKLHTALALALFDTIRKLHERGIALMNLSPKNLFILVSHDKKGNLGVELMPTDFSYSLWAKDLCRVADRTNGSPWGTNRGFMGSGALHGKPQLSDDYESALRVLGSLPLPSPGFYESRPALRAMRLLLEHPAEGADDKPLGDMLSLATKADKELTTQERALLATFFQKEWAKRPPAQKIRILFGDADLHKPGGLLGGLLANAPRDVDPREYLLDLIDSGLEQPGPALAPDVRQRIEAARTELLDSLRRDHKPLLPPRAPKAVEEKAPPPTKSGGDPEALRVAVATAVAAVAQNQTAKAHEGSARDGSGRGSSHPFGNAFDDAAVVKAFESIARLENAPVEKEEWGAFDRSLKELEALHHKYEMTVPGKAVSFAEFVAALGANRQLAPAVEKALKNLAIIRDLPGHTLYEKLKEWDKLTPRERLALEHDAARREIEMDWAATKLNLSNRKAVTLAGLIDEAYKRGALPEIVDTLIPNLATLNERDLPKVIEELKRHQNDPNREARNFSRLSDVVAQMEKEFRTGKRPGESNKEFEKRVQKAAAAAMDEARLSFGPPEEKPSTATPKEKEAPGVVSPKVDHDRGRNIEKAADRMVEGRKKFDEQLQHFLGMLKKMVKVELVEGKVKLTRLSGPEADRARTRFVAEVKDIPKWINDTLETTLPADSPQNPWKREIPSLGRLILTALSQPAGKGKLTVDFGPGEEQPSLAPGKEEKKAPRKNRFTWDADADSKKFREAFSEFDKKGGTHADGGGRSLTETIVLPPTPVTFPGASSPGTQDTGPQAQAGSQGKGSPASPASSPANSNDKKDTPEAPKPGDKDPSSLASSATAHAHDDEGQPRGGIRAEMGGAAAKEPVDSLSPASGRRNLPSALAAVKRDKSRDPRVTPFAVDAQTLPVPAVESKPEASGLLPAPPMRIVLNFEPPPKSERQASRSLPPAQVTWPGTTGVTTYPAPQPIVVAPPAPAKETKTQTIPGRSAEGRAYLPGDPPPAGAVRETTPSAQYDKPTGRRTKETTETVERTADGVVLRVMKTEKFLSPDGKKKTVVESDTEMSPFFHTATRSKVLKIVYDDEQEPIEMTETKQEIDPVLGVVTKQVEIKDEFKKGLLVKETETETHYDGPPAHFAKSAVITTVTWDMDPTAEIASGKTVMTLSFDPATGRALTSDTREYRRGDLVLGPLVRKPLILAERNL